MTIKHTKTLAQGDGGDATLALPSDWNADHPITLGLTLPLNAAPATPASNNLTLFARKIGGRMLPAFIGPSGLDSTLQPHLARNKILLAQGAGNSSTPTYLSTALTAVGTATAKNWASTSMNTSMRGVDYIVTVAATTAVAGFRSAAAQFWFGNAAGLGGFYYICRWAPATGTSVTTHRAFCGMRNVVTAPTDVNPSTYVNMFGMGWDNGDAQISFMCNDASGTATKTALGASFPNPTVNYTNVYELAMFCAPNTTTVYYEVTLLNTGAVATGSVNTDLPSTTTAFSPMAYHSVGGTSSVVGLTLYTLYVETDY